MKEAAFWLYTKCRNGLNIESCLQACRKQVSAFHSAFDAHRQDGLEESEKLSLSPGT